MTKISEKGLVILQPTINLKPDHIKRYKERFKKDIENGVLIVPRFFEVIYVPEGVEVGTEADNDKHK